MLQGVQASTASPQMSWKVWYLKVWMGEQGVRDAGNITGRQRVRGRGMLLVGVKVKVWSAGEVRKTLST